MIVVAIVASALVFGLAVEILRWRLRPEGRRLRVIKKIGGSRE